MRRCLIVTVASFFTFPTLCRAQVSGNVGYSQNGGKARALQNERNKRVLTKEEMPPTGTSTFVEANVLLNVRADEFVAVFGVLQEGETIAECSRKVDAAIKQFTDEVKTIGIGDGACFVDFIAQNKIYGYEVAGDIAREKLVGFELKKNVSIHYKDTALLEKIVLGRVSLANLRSDQGRLHRLEQGCNSGQAHGRGGPDHQAQGEPIRKAARYQTATTSTDLCGKSPPSIIRPGMYDSYMAFESEHVGVPVSRPGMMTRPPARAARSSSTASTPTVSTS